MTPLAAARLVRMARVNVQQTTLAPRRKSRSWAWMLPGNILALILLALIAMGKL